MPELKVLALVMAGGEGSRLEVLTEHRAKPAMPYAGVYRLIDFPLTNCMHSGIRDVWIAQQYQPHSLNDHVSNGRPWDLDRTKGGLRLLFPYTGEEEGGWHQGNADAIWRNANLIREAAPDVLIVLSADHIYKLDYRAPIDAHLSNDADVTLVTTKVERGEAARFGVVEVDEHSRVGDYQYKPDDPASNIATTEVFVFKTEVLLELLGDLARERRTNGDDGVSLEDLGDAVLPRLVKAGGAYEHRLEGYWRDVGTVESYWSSHMDLLEESPALDLDDRSWRLHTLDQQRMPARISGSARIVTSLISPGSKIRGRIEHSVVGPGVVLEEGAVVRDSIIFQDCVIKAGASVDCSILDEGVTVGSSARVGEQRGEQASPKASDITLVGLEATVAESSKVAGGDRIQGQPRR